MNIIFFFFWVCVGLVAACGLSLAVASKGYSLVACGLLTVVASLVGRARVQ